MKILGIFFCGQGWYLRMKIDGKMMEKFYVSYTVVLTSPPSKGGYTPPTYICSSLYISTNKQPEGSFTISHIRSFYYLDAKSPQNTLKRPKIGTFKSRKRDNIYCEKYENVSQIDRKTGCIVAIYLIFTYFLTLWN